VIPLAGAVVVESDCTVGWRLHIVAADAGPWIALMIHWRKCSAAVFQYPDRARPRPIQNEVIQFTGSVVIERKGAIRGSHEVEAADAGPRIALMIDGRKCPAAVLQYPDRAGSERGDPVSQFRRSRT